MPENSRERCADGWICEEHPDQPGRILTRRNRTCVMTRELPRYQEQSPWLGCSTSTNKKGAARGVPNGTDPLWRAVLRIAQCPVFTTEQTIQGTEL
jgi:hypothetical protein